MRSEVMGKTMAIFMVMAMIATGIVLLSDSTEATGAYTVTGIIKNDVTDENVGGVKITITNATLSVDKNVTSKADGTFSISVEKRGDYDLTLTKYGYMPKTIPLLNETFNETSKTADVGIQLIKPLPTVSGRTVEFETDTVINGVEVTVKNGTTGTVIEQVMTVNGVFSVPVSANEVDIYFKKDGYYNNNKENIEITNYGTTDIGNVFLEKIVPTPTIKVWGIVFEQGTTDTLPGAIVSISAGDDKWITAVSDDVGYYEMRAYPGNFQIKASLTGYNNTIPEWFNVPSDKSIRKNINLDKTPPETNIVSGNIFDKDGIDAIPAANIFLYSTDGKYLNHTYSNDTGYYEIKFYPPNTGVSFVLEVRKQGFFTNASVTNITTSNTSAHVRLTEINEVHELHGFVYDIESEETITGATVTIYNKVYLHTNSTKTKSNGYYNFMIHDNTSYWIVFDAEGYQSLIVEADNIKIDKHYLEAGLIPSGTDVVKTTYTFLDWNTIMISQNSTITVDNASVRLNADRRFGMGLVGLEMNDGILNETEIQAWADYLKDKGLEKRDTKGLLTLNNTYYELNATTYEVSIEGAVGDVSALTTIYINSSYNYTLVTELENPDSDIFELVFNATYDSAFMDYTNHIILPLEPVKFEMTANTTETNMVEVTGYNDPIIINPMVHDGDMETVTMTIERSLNGTAKAKVIGGIHHILNSTYDNYTVIVPMGPSGGRDTTVEFSAEGSTDEIGDINKANFTWSFGDGIVGYGMKVEHNYTNASHDGELTVRLVITETGGNKTYRNITVFVDSQNPMARISADVTDSGNITFDSETNTLTVNENTPITFSGNHFEGVEGIEDREIAGQASYDDIKSDDKKGIIEKWYWSWGEEDSFDETITKDGSNNITHSYGRPGTYTLNMTVTDVVGRESPNATWTVIVMDTTPPTPDFKITSQEDPSLVVIEVTENKVFQYNASLTTDNFEDLGNLTFEWFFDIDGTVATRTGMVVNFTFNKVGLFNVTMRATDRANNSENKTVLVNVNLGARPNILMLSEMTFNPTVGSAGKPMTVSVNITNDGKANATSIQTSFYIRNPDGTDTLIGNVTTEYLGIGETATASISWTPKKKGEFTIWANATCADEHSSQWWDNKIEDFNTQRVTVKEAAWVMPAIALSIVVIIVLVFFGMKYFMKSGTKEEDYGEKRKKR